MHLARSSLLVAALCCSTACDSKVESESLNPTLQKQVNAIIDCFPQLFAKGQDVLAVAETWRMNKNGSEPIPDPPGLVHAGTGPIDVTYTIDDCTIEMTIRFYDPSGAEQTGVGTGTTLAEKIDNGATAIGNSNDPFIVGEWTLTGTKGGSAFAGDGALTGIIGGSLNQNELEELRTTTATPAGGPPPNADCTVSEADCTLTFNTTGLLTDQTPGQEYPEGVVTVTIDSDGDTVTDVTATVTFDGTATIRIAIDGVERFTFDVETRTLSSIAP